jgi:hypothetical protein
VTDEEILQAYLSHPDITFLTFTRNASNRVNNVVITNIFANEQALCHAQLECDLPPVDIN